MPCISVRQATNHYTRVPGTNQNMFERPCHFQGRPKLHILMVPLTDSEGVTAAYEQGSSSGDVSGGGFLIEDALSGSFPSKSFSDENEDALRLKDLPEALRHAGVQGSAFQEVQDLLESSAAPSPLVNDMVIPKNFFIQAVEAALNVPHVGPRRSKRPPRPKMTDLADSEDVEISSNDEFSPEDKSPNYSSESDDMAGPYFHTTKSTSRTRLTASKRAQAQILFRLILERLPLDLPQNIQKHERHRIRSDVSDLELHSRRIGVDELRYVAQSLNENPNISELFEMLSEATRIYYETENQESHSSAHPDVHRIGLQEYVLPLT